MKNPIGTRQTPNVSCFCPEEAEEESMEKEREIITSTKGDRCR